MAIFTGSGVAIITPMKDNGEIDYPAFEKLIELQIAGGTDAIIVCGTTGEASTQSHEEHLETVKFCVDVVKKRVPVIAGTGSNSTDTAVYLSKEAESYGVDAVLLVSPYYNKATQNGLYMHFKTTADAINIPVILYNVPSRTGCNIQPATAVKIAQTVENIVGIKEASGNISQVAELAHLANGCLDIYSGNDDQIVPLMALGGIGVISVTANIIPEDTHELCQSFLDGNVERARELQLKAIDLCKALFCEVNPIPVKKASQLLGLSNGKVRLPLTEMEPENAAKLEKAMLEYGIQF